MDEELHNVLHRLLQFIMTGDVVESSQLSDADRRHLFSLNPEL